MCNARPRCPEAVVGLANRVRSEEPNKFILAVSYASCVPLVDGIRPFHEMREWDQWVSTLLDLIKQLSLGLIKASPTQLQLVVHRPIF